MYLANNFLTTIIGTGVKPGTNSVVPGITGLPQTSLPQSTDQISDFSLLLGTSQTISSQKITDKNPVTIKVPERTESQSQSLGQNLDLVNKTGSQADDSLIASNAITTFVTTDSRTVIDAGLTQVLPQSEYQLTSTENSSYPSIQEIQPDIGIFNQNFQAPTPFISPIPSGTPGVQTGPVVTQLDLKAPVTPQISTAPGVQTGPAVTQLDPKILTSNVTLASTQAISTNRHLAEIAPLLHSVRTIVSNQPKPVSNVSSGAVNASTLTAAQVSVVSSANHGANVVVSHNNIALTPNVIGIENPGHTAKAIEPGSLRLVDIGLDVRPVAQDMEPVQLVRAGQEQTVVTPKAMTSALANMPRLDQASLAGFASALAQRVQSGATKFEIRLDPAELGRVQVRMEVSADNRVEAVVSTQRPEVLADLQRGADSLRRALAEAGFELGTDGLSFSLEQGSQNTGADQDTLTGYEANSAGTQEDNAEQMRTPPVEIAQNYGLTRMLNVRVDVKV